MSDGLGPVSAVLEEDLRAAVSRGGLVVWLDADDAYSRFVERLVARRAAGGLPYEIKAYRGSHLELMFALEDAASGGDKPALVVHMPGYNEESVRSTPALELYLAGSRYRKALDTLIAEAAAGIAAPEAIEEFRRQKDVTLERADAWLAELAAAREVGLRGTLRLMKLRDLIDELVRGDGVAGQVAAADNLRAVWAHLEAVTGLPASWREGMVLPQRPGPGERVKRLAEDVAFAAASWALVVEYVDDLRREPKDARLLGVRALPRAVIDACRGLAEHLRREQPEFYKRVAEETEDSLAGKEIEEAVAADLGRVDTFEFEEKKVYEAALAALAAGRWEVARTWAHERLDGSSFWIELRGSLRRPAWEVVQAAAGLGLALSAAGSGLQAESHEAAVQRYVTRGAAVDLAHRALEQRWHGVSGALLPMREELRAQVGRIRALWHDWADGWARQFSDLCRAHGFVPAPGMQQRTIFEEVVRPMTAQAGTTVVFMVDALRYEMAEELRRELGEPGATTIELRARLAELPTITAVGMNALAPVAERGKLRPAVREMAIVGMQRGEYRVENPASRQRAMHERVDKAKCPLMTLDEVVEDDAAGLKRRIAGAKLAIVHETAIDSAGEKGNGLMVFGSVLQRLRAACNLLREAGARRFVITADHGFLLLDDRLRQVRPFGRTNDPWRRHVIRDVAADEPGTVRVPLAQLEYEGVDGLQLLMPEGTAVFDIGKKTLSFVHGGGSLQERVIPVLTIVHRSGGAGGDATAYSVQARAQEGVAGLHSIAAKVQRMAQHALEFGGRRQVELALKVEGEDEVLVDALQTRGAVVRAGSIVATVDADFEVFFRLVGPREARVRVTLYHPTHEAEVEPCVLEEFFAVTAVRAVEEKPQEPAKAPAAAPEPAKKPAGRAWLEAFTDAGVRELFEHLAVHGVVTEDQAAKILGGARAVRRFSNAFDEYAKKAPFVARIETVGGVKRYVREGQER